jgi:hypothetical protein
MDRNIHEVPGRSLAALRSDLVRPGRYLSKGSRVLDGKQLADPLGRLRLKILISDLGHDAMALGPPGKRGTAQPDDKQQCKGDRLH